MRQLLFRLGVIAGVVFSAPSAGFAYARDPTGSSGQSGTSGGQGASGQPGGAPPGPAVVTVPGEEMQAEAALARNWRLELLAGGGYDDNVPFLLVPEADISGTLRARLTRWFRGPRGTFSLGASGDAVRYRDLQQYDQFNYGADLSATYSTSPRTTFTLMDTFSKGYTGDSVVLTDAGVLLPRTVSKTNTAGFDVAHRISPLWTWNASAVHQMVLFDSDLVFDGSTLLGRATIDRKGARDSIAISYEFRRDWVTNRSSADAHGPNLRVERSFAKAPAIWVDLGARRVQAVVGTANPVVFSGGAGLVRRSTKQVIDARVERSAEQAYGLGGVQIRSAVSLRFVRTVTARVTLDLFGNVGRNAPPGADASLLYDTRDLSASLGFRLAKDIRLDAGGGYRSLERSTASRVESRFATLRLRVGKNW